MSGNNVRRCKSQNGVTLLISMIMLVIITLLTISSFKTGKGDLEVVGNIQQRNQAVAAAQSAIEQTISLPQFSKTPADAVPSPCVSASGVRQPNTICADFYGDGKSKISVKIIPTCVRIKPVPSAALDPAKPDDAGCTLGVGQSFGVAGTSSDSSLCSDALWDIQADSLDLNSGAKASLNQGVVLRQSSTTGCP